MTGSEVDFVTKEYDKINQDFEINILVSYTNINH